MAHGSHSGFAHVFRGADLLPNVAIPVDLSAGFYRTVSLADTVGDFSAVNRQSGSQEVTLYPFRVALALKLAGPAAQWSSLPSRSWKKGLTSSRTPRRSVPKELRHRVSLGAGV